MTNKVQFKFSLPPEVKKWLQTRAEQNLRSQSAELLALLRDNMSKPEAKDEDEKL